MAAARIVVIEDEPAIRRGVIDVLRAQALASQFRQEKILFIRGVIGPDDAELAAAGLHVLEPSRDHLERL